MNNPVVLYDGVCAFCNSSVRWLIRKDKKEILRFASLQSKTAQTLLETCRGEKPVTDSVILVRDGQVFTETDAVVAILQTIGYWRFAAGLLASIPRPWRNAVYRLIAKNRYRWFGKHDQCPIPSADIRARFLQDL